MKASELIIKLKELKEAYGDKDVKTSMSTGADDLVYEDVVTLFALVEDGVVFFNLI